MYIVIGGAGLVGLKLTRELCAHNHDVVVIELDKSVCERIYAETGALTINGSATDINILEEAGMSRADVAVALMRNDSDNLAFCLLAKEFGTPRIMGRVREPMYRSAYRAAGATVLAEITSLVAHQLQMAIEQPTVQRLVSLGSGQADVVLLTIPAGARVANQTIQEITNHKRFPRGCVFAGIYRPETDHFIVPRGDQQIMAGDQVFLAAAAQDIAEASTHLLAT